MVLLRRLPVDWIRVVAEGWHCLERIVESWLRRLELLCLLDGPAGVPHKFGFLFNFILSRVFSFFRDIDWLCDQHLSHESGRTIFGGLPEVHGLGLFLVLGLY